MKRKSEEIQLGSLPPFEYGMLRAALRYAEEYCICEANGRRPMEAAVAPWRDRASEFRALRSRFLKRGRRGVKR